MTAANDGLSAVERKFVLHWGEMGTKWGVNRTVAQVHALLYISPEPLNADDIVAILDVARSNVSTSLKELQGWGIVRRVHVQDDKRDHFESLKDVWEMFRIVMDDDHSLTLPHISFRLARNGRDGVRRRLASGGGPSAREWIAATAKIYALAASQPQWLKERGVAVRRRVTVRW